ncbi:MAG: DUF255 domain-containing protein [Bacteroidales bacterium]|nr:DUF255 domain-containing protein [Bacteroidales bacterium]
MKKSNFILAIIILLSISYNSNAQTETPKKINWMSFEEAVKLNDSAPKKIFIDIYTDWCGWCKKMDQTTFLDEEVIDYMNEHFYAVKFNAEQTESVDFMGYTFVNPNPLGTQKGTHQLAAALLQGKMSYPSYVFLNEQNIGITVLPGYVDASKLMPALKYVATNAYLTTQWNDFLKQDNK